MSSTVIKPIAVVKVGGDMLLHASDRQGFAENVKDLIDAGWQCVILHGGGPQLNELQELHGLEPNKVDGRRITSVDDLRVVKQALCGEVNVDLVAALLGAGINAFGCHGASGLLIEAEKRPAKDMGVHGLIDFGEVGDVLGVNVDLLYTLLKADLVPVVASLGASRDGRVFNINADTTVSAIASSVKAELLILSTMVGGVFSDINDPLTRVPQLNAEFAAGLIKEGVIRDGMIPKVQEALALLEKGVASIVIANASKSGAFLDLTRGSARHGTRLVK